MKSISWKQSIIIVILLHVFGYIALSQYSKYKTTLAKQMKEAKNSLYSSSASSQDWPKPSAKKVVTYPTPKIPKEKTKEPIVINENTIKDFVGDIQDMVSKQFFNKEIKIPPTTKAIVKTQTSKPSVKPTNPSPKTTKTSNTVYTSTKTYHTPPQSIPVRRAIAVPPHESIVNNIPQYPSNNSDFRETTQTVQRVVKTYVILQ
jgi:hypothetical protein